SSRGFSPEAMYSTSCSRAVIGVSATWLGLDKGGLAGVCLRRLARLRIEPPLPRSGEVREEGAAFREKPDLILHPTGAIGGGLFGPFSPRAEKGANDRQPEHDINRLGRDDAGSHRRRRRHALYPVSVHRF